MPKDNAAKTKAQRAEWDIRRRMLKDQAPYKGSDTEKEHKKQGEKDKK